MSPIERLNKTKEKYPYIIKDGLIDLNRIGQYLNIYNFCLENNNTDFLTILNLENFKEDLKWILLDTKKDRKTKLNKLQNESSLH